MQFLQIFLGKFSKILRHEADHKLETPRNFFLRTPLNDCITWMEVI